MEGEREDDIFVVLSGGGVPAQRMCVSYLSVGIDNITGLGLKRSRPGLPEQSCRLEKIYCGNCGIFMCDFRI